MERDNLLISFPDYYNNDEYVQFEIESKGYFVDVYVKADSKLYRISFYDAVRLSQDITLHLEEGNPYFFEENLLILTKVTKEKMTQAILALVENGGLNVLKADED